MRSLRDLLFGALLLIIFSPNILFAQITNIGRLYLDLKIVEKEEAAAKEIRLKWITEERIRLRGELQKYESELSEYKAILPDPIKPRIVPPAIAKTHQREQLAFNNWAANNDPSLNSAVLKGSGINALLRVLGPVAHYRSMKKSADPENVHFPSLADSNAIPVEDVSHFRMVPATSAGSNVVVRLNKLPLDLQWPPVLIQEWPAECRDILRLRDEYVSILSSPLASDTRKLSDRAELLDSSLELLQAMAIKKKRLTPHNVSLSAFKKNQVHRELQDAVRYLETIRATADRFKSAPNEFRVHEFAGGSIEAFLDFCFTHGMVFQEARPVDQSEYFRVYRRMQDYARDVQFLEDWKGDIKQRIQELNEEDKKLVWHAASQ